MKKAVLWIAISSAFLCSAANAGAQQARCEGAIVMSEEDRQTYDSLPEIIESAATGAGGTLVTPDRMESYLAFNNLTVAEMVDMSADELSEAPQELGVDWMLFVQVRGEEGAREGAPEAQAAEPVAGEEEAGEEEATEEEPAEEEAAEEEPAEEEASEPVFHVKVTVVPAGSGNLYRTFDGPEDPWGFESELRKLLFGHFESTCKGTDASASSAGSARNGPAQNQPAQNRYNQTPPPRHQTRARPAQRQFGPGERENPADVNYLPQVCQSNYDCDEWATCSRSRRRCYVTKGTDIPVEEVFDDFNNTFAIRGGYGASADPQFANMAVVNLGMTLKYPNNLTALFDYGVYIGIPDSDAYEVDAHIHLGAGLGYRLYQTRYITLTATTYLDGRIRPDTPEEEEEEPSYFDDEPESPTVPPETGFFLDGRTGLRFDLPVFSVETAVTYRGPGVFVLAGFEWDFGEWEDASDYE